MRFDKLLWYTFLSLVREGWLARVFLMCTASGVRTGVQGRVHVHVRVPACVLVSMQLSFMVIGDKVT